MKSYNIPLNAMMGGLPVYGEVNHNEKLNPHNQYILKNGSDTFSPGAISSDSNRYIKIYSAKINGNDTSISGEFEILRKDGSATLSPMYADICFIIKSIGTLNSANVKAGINLRSSRMLSRNNFTGLLYQDANGYFVLEIWYYRENRGTSGYTDENNDIESGSQYKIIEKLQEFSSWDLSGETNKGDYTALNSTDFATYATGKTTVECTGGTKLVSQLMLFYDGAAWAIQNTNGSNYKFDASNLGVPSFAANVLTFAKQSGTTRCIVNEKETRIVSMIPYIGASGAVIPYIPSLNYTTDYTNKGIRFIDTSTSAYASAVSTKMSMVLTLEFIG